MAGLSSGKTISIYGTGAVGSALAIALSKQGFALRSLINRTIVHAEELNEQCTEEAQYIVEEPLNNEHIGEILFLTVRDDGIADVVASLAGKEISFSRKIVVHCSGALDSGVLKPLKDKGAAIVAMHPMQTFGRSAENPFRDIYFSLEGDETAVAEMEELASALGAQTVRISAEDKPVIHASAAVASNFLVTLMHQAAEIAEKAGIEKQEAFNMLKPLVQTTFSNVAKEGSVNALTGPIARGDIETIKKHIELLYNDQEQLSFYAFMGIYTCKLALERGQSNENEINIIGDLLRSLNNQ